MFILLHIEASSFILLTKVNYERKCRCLGKKCFFSQKEKREAMMFLLCILAVQSVSKVLN